MALWTGTFIIFDLVDSRVGWRDYWTDWLFGSGAIAFYVIGSWSVSRLMGSQAPLPVVFPQLILSIIAYPLIARVVVGLDRWRLAR